MTYRLEQQESVLFIVLDGDLIGGFSAQSLIETISEKLMDGLRLCGIDISGVRYMNSSGIDLLITLLTKFRNKGGEVVLINPSEQVKKLLVITKLVAIFHVVENREQAVLRLEESL